MLIRCAVLECFIKRWNHATAKSLCSLSMAFWHCLYLMKFRRQLFAGLFSQRLLDEPACVTAFGTGEAFGFNLCLAIG